MDEETRQICIRYAGRNFDKSQQITVEVLDQWGGEDWSLNEFRVLVDEAIEAIPKEYRAKAKVELGGGFEETLRLRIYYTRPENQAEIDERVARCLQYAKERLEGERAAYERLKQKYG
jgi:hypothetical protein